MIRILGVWKSEWVQIVPSGATLCLLGSWISGCRALLCRGTVQATLGLWFHLVCSVARCRCWTMVGLWIKSCRIRGGASLFAGTVGLWVCLVCPVAPNHRCWMMASSWVKSCRVCGGAVFPMGLITWSTTRPATMWMHHRWGVVVRRRYLVTRFQLLG